MISLSGVSQNVLSGLSVIGSLSSPILTSIATASEVSTQDTRSAVVQFSAIGQVLGAGSTLQESLLALQANPSKLEPDNVLTRAQGFVAAFNGLQESIGRGQSQLADSPASALIEQFSQALSAAATSSVPGDTPNQASLQSLGISLQSPSPFATATSTPRLVIDPIALNIAANGNPGGTLTLLAQATQSLEQQVVAFETTASQLTGPVIDFSTFGSGLASSALSGPGPVAPEDITPSRQNNGPATFGGIDATPQVASQSPIPTNTTSAIDTQNASSTLSAVGADTISAAQRAANATLTLQTLLADPALLAINNSNFNPFYSALMAASHPSDFTTPSSFVRASAIDADIPAPVRPIERVRDISGFGEHPGGMSGSRSRANRLAT